MVQDIICYCGEIMDWVDSEWVWVCPFCHAAKEPYEEADPPFPF